MKDSYRFFSNRACKYFPCHEGVEDFNCLFCYCPFYLKEKCPGKPTFIWSKDKKHIIKDCSGCTYPHQPESYDVINNWIIKENEKREFSQEIQKKAITISKGEE